MQLGKFFRKRKRESASADVGAVSIELEEKPEETGILILGGMSGIGEKNCIAVFHRNNNGVRNAVVIDCGEKLGGENPEECVDGEGSPEEPAIDDRYPDLSLLDGFDVKLLALTHAHKDHIGGTHKFAAKFPDVPFMGHKFTLDEVEDHLRKNKVGVMPKRIEEEIYEVGSFKITWFIVNHTTHGAGGFLVEVGEDAFVFTGDCKEWVVREDERPDKNKEVFGRIAELARGKRITLIQDSTNSEKVNQHIVSENVVARNVGTIMDREPGRVFVLVISSNVQRIRLIIEEAQARGREVYVAGPTMRRFLRREETYYDETYGWKKMALKAIRNASRNGNGFEFRLDPDVETLPANAIIICTWSQADADSFMGRFADNKFDFPYKRGDVLVNAQSVIPRKAVRERFERMMMKLVGRNGRYGVKRRLDRVYLSDSSPYIPSSQQGGAEVIRCPLYNNGKMEIGSIHCSGHGNLEFKLLLWELLGRPVVIPWHGYREIRQTLADAIREQGGRAILLDDGEKYILPPR